MQVFKLFGTLAYSSFNIYGCVSVSAFASLDCVPVGIIWKRQVE